MPAAADEKALPATFRHEVSITASELKKRLKTDKSKSIRQPEGSTSYGAHWPGEHTTRILHKKKASLAPDDGRPLPWVPAYGRRHLTQRPQGDVGHAPWCCSLRGWGHDPLRK